MNHCGRTPETTPTTRPYDVGKELAKISHSVDSFLQALVSAISESGAFSFSRGTHVFASRASWLGQRRFGAHGAAKDAHAKW